MAPHPKQIFAVWWRPWHPTSQPPRTPSLVLGRILDPGVPRSRVYRGPTYTGMRVCPGCGYTRMRIQNGPECTLVPCVVKSQQVNRVLLQAQQVDS